MVFSGNKADVAFLIGKFKDWTELEFQVTGAATFTIGTSKQGLESTVPADGMALSQANTAGNQPPYKCAKKGEVWGIPSADGSTLVVIAGQDLQNAR